MGRRLVALKRHLPTGEIVVGVAIVILSAGVLPLWAAFVGLAFVVVGTSGLPWTTGAGGSGSESGARSRLWLVLPILMIIVGLMWFARPAPDANSRGVTTPGTTAAGGDAVQGPPSPGPSTEKSDKVKPAPASKPAGDALLAVFSARHKHRIRDCKGLLTFSMSSVRFQTDHPDDSFVYSIDQVELNNDGVKDRFGKSWHFAVDGRDMGDVFARWKAGVLPVQHEAP